MSRFAAPLMTLCTLVALIGVPSASSGEPIPVGILGNSLTLQGTAGTLSLVGEHGFTFTGVVSIVGGFFGPDISCSPCAPGAPVNLNATWVGNDLPGVATLEGVTYPNVGSPNGPSLLVMFLGSTFAPTTGGLTGTATGPFQFQGTFSLPLTGPAAQLFGNGTATINLVRGSPGTSWDYTAASSALYEFEPVPEPCTLLLVGSTLAGMALRRRRPKES